jgi:DNA-binding NarL/FixJ family response regulator
MDRLRVLVADDDDKMRGLLALLLEEEFVIIGAVRNGRDLIEKTLELRPNVIVSYTCLSLLVAMKLLNNVGDVTPLVLVGSSFRCGETSMYQGAQAYVDQCDLASDLNAAVRSAAEGRRFVSRSIAEPLA